MTFREVKADLLKGASYCVDYQYLAKRLYNPEKKIILFQQNDYTFLSKRLFVLPKRLYVYGVFFHYLVVKLQSI